MLPHDNSFNRYDVSCCACKFVYSFTVGLIVAPHPMKALRCALLYDNPLSLIFSLLLKQI